MDALRKQQSKMYAFWICMTNTISYSKRGGQSIEKDSDLDLVVADKEDKKQSVIHLELKFSVRILPEH